MEPGEFGTRLNLVQEVMKGFPEEVRGDLKT